MILISSAQNQEDIMLWRALQQVEQGFYIDVGAADPVSCSVTKLFYEHGWSGINLEPNPAYFAMLERARPRDINLQAGAGAQAGTMIFHIIEDSGLSTFDPEIAARHAADGWKVTEQVSQVLTLAEICRRFRPEGPIHFLKIDAEGFEGAVLAGADFQTFRPWIILAEATLPLSREASHAQWEPILTRQRYGFVWFDGLNRFYLAEEMQAALGQCFQVQPNVFDPFSNPAELLQRAETAERALARQTELTAHARHRCEALLVSLVKAREMHTDSLARADAAAAAAAKAAAGAAAAEAALSRAQARAADAEAKCEAMLANTSWRITVPFRRLVEILRNGAIRLDAGKRRPKTITVKDFFRKCFHRGVGRLLQFGLGRKMLHFGYAMMPSPVEFLARRYRAYDGRAAAMPAATIPVEPDDSGKTDDPGEHNPAISGLSAAESLLSRQIETALRGRAALMEN